jgi:hypothetical protein
MKVGCVPILQPRPRRIRRWSGGWEWFERVPRLATLAPGPNAKGE